MTRVTLFFLFLVVFVGGLSYVLLHINSLRQDTSLKNAVVQKTKVSAQSTPIPTTSSSLSIETMRQKSYPGSVITIEQTMSSRPNYNRFVVSYLSDGLKIYGLLTVPTGQKPPSGWPVILFNHGYIPPASYSTVSSYDVMVDPLAAAGFIVFKPDYRGNGNSQGSPSQPYITPDYITDSMNALASIKKYKDANPQKIGVFGHSMGGNITLHELVMTHDFKAAELMAGVVGNEEGLANWWAHRFAVHSIVGNDLDTYYVFEKIVQDHGTPRSDPSYWNAIDPIQFISFINSPVQIQVGSADEDVPVDFSNSLKETLQNSSKVVSYIMYPGADHNLIPDTSSAMQTAISFFNKYLK